jgi:hypothetical protein
VVAPWPPAFPLPHYQLLITLLNLLPLDLVIVIKQPRLSLQSVLVAVETLEDPLEDPLSLKPWILLKLLGSPSS